ncbi:unnamed protein product [Candidula unifasciata]|uniref:UDP-glucuronosyltransferase n=1 Tax=Candidula unifasciata TaxID=100452 RepID=A0A8S3ZPG4_9EUPU|nr:unnamed protein product [Candidula unifasciata]
MMGKYSLLLAAVTLTLLLANSAGKTVVFFPPPLTSYFIYHTNIAGALARMGHDVYLCVPHYLISKNLVKDKDVKILEYGEQLGDITGKAMKNTNMMEKFWAGDSLHPASTMFMASAEFGRVTVEILSDKVLVEKIRRLKPDLLVVDSIPFNMNMIVLPYLLDVPYALVGTLHDVVLSKVPYSPATPTMLVKSHKDRMSFFNRVQHFFWYVAQINFDLYYDSSCVSKFAPHKPYRSINELAANAEVFIIELDHILDYPRPTLPNTKLIGGSSPSLAKPLTGELLKFVNESKNGIIVMTFGGTVVNLPPHFTSKMASAFKQLDLRVVWRVNMTSPDPKQILTSTWIPQNDLLGHEKTKLFVSHCGKNGQYEALYHGVPILCMPIFGDQYYNAERVADKELGLYADMRTASTEQLAAMLKEIIYQKKYTENMKRASSLYRELYKDPKQEAAYWLDHVMKYGGDYMRSAGQQMPWYQLYVLDVIAFLLTVLLAALFIIYFIIKQSLKCCGFQQKKVKAKNE